MNTMLESNVNLFAAAVGVTRACAAFGVNPRTHRHRQQKSQGRLPSRPKPSPRPRRAHPAALSEDEKSHVVDVLCSKRFADLAPAQVYSRLLDEGTYLCSERQMYRILAERGLVRDRRRGGHSRRGSYAVPRQEADGPNQVWCWDITKLRGPTKGVFYFLYTILDIFSRKVVGWMIAERENKKNAKKLIKGTCKTEGINKDQLVIHADRGSPMISGTVAELLIDLGVAKSHSRPRVSNDNPYIESHFKTFKYRPDYPQRFDSITAARTFTGEFITWSTKITTTAGSETYTQLTSTKAPTWPSWKNDKKHWIPPTPPTRKGSPNNQTP